MRLRWPKVEDALEWTGGEGWLESPGNRKWVPRRRWLWAGQGEHLGLCGKTTSRSDYIGSGLRGRAKVCDQVSQSRHTWFTSGSFGDWPGI